MRLAFYGNIYLQVMNAVQVIVRGMCGLLCVQIVSSVSSVASNAVFLFNCSEVSMPPSLLCRLTSQSVASKIYSDSHNSRQHIFSGMGIWVSVPMKAHYIDFLIYFQLVCNQEI